MQALLNFYYREKKAEIFVVNSVICYAEKDVVLHVFSVIVYSIFIYKKAMFFFGSGVGFVSKDQSGSMMFLVCLSSKFYFPRNLVLNVSKCVIYCFELCKLLSCFTVV